MTKPLTAKELLELDPYFRVKTLAAIERPQRVSWLAMHQDYSENFVPSEVQYLDHEESWYGERLVRNCLEHGHYGVLEHPQLVLACAGFPHSVMQQLRTHRHFSFDVQSSRYSGKRFLDESRDIEELVYLRPVNRTYIDRQGDPYLYTPEMREVHVAKAMRNRAEYCSDLTELGLSEEHARGHNSFDIRQHFIVSGNLRAWLHIIMLRHKKNAQLECQAWCEGVLDILREWAPEVMEHWETKGTRLKLTP